MYAVEKDVRVCPISIDKSQSKFNETRSKQIKTNKGKKEKTEKQNKKKIKPFK